MKQSIRVSVLIAIGVNGGCEKTSSKSLPQEQGFGSDHHGGIGGRESYLGIALVDLLRARKSGPDDDVDTAILDVLRIQCRDVVLPAGLTLRKEDIGRFLPLERLADADTAYCGSFLLNDGTWAVAPAFKDIVKPP